MMRITLTGGGTGGHIYPLLAVADKIKTLANAPVDFSYIGPHSPLNKEFTDRAIRIRTILSSKIRRYADIRNMFDVPKFFISIFQSLLWLYIEMPDVVFSKGGPGAFTVVMAAWLYRIPVVIHESDAVPGLTNRLSGYLAAKVALAFSSAAEFFSKRKIAFTGNPIRAGLLEDRPSQETAKKDLGFSAELPLLVVVGGSQGSMKINMFIAENLKEILSVAQVYHQVGAANGQAVQDLLAPALAAIDAALWVRYKMIPYLELPAIVKTFSAADVILSRAGSGAIYEIASFRKPAILIPLSGSANDHQRANAYAYSLAGAAAVFEENNLGIHLFISKLKEILEKPDRRQKMIDAAKHFFTPEAAETIAKEVLLLGWR